jgi:hypothetical protein
MSDQIAVWKIDGTKVDVTPQNIVGQLLASVPDLQFRSIDAIRTLFIGLLDLSIEMALIEKENKKGGERSALTRYINSISKQKRYIPTDRIKLLTSLYDRILQIEGLGLLQGFGFENSKVGNAERTSNVIQLYTNEKENIMATKKKETKEVVKIKRSELINVAKELNTVLEPDPEIEVSAPSEELIPILVEAAKLLEPGDKISAVTQKVLDNLPEAAEPVAEPEETEPVPEAVVEPEGKEKKGAAEPEKAAEKKKTTLAKEKSPAAAKKEKKGPGIIATIVACIEKAPVKGISKEAILEKLVATFPERDADSMRKTINVQVPARITKERFPIETLASGNYKKK